MTDTVTKKGTTVVATLDPKTGHWRAKFAPQVAGGDYTLTASCTSCDDANSTTLHSITFGDVYVRFECRVTLHSALTPILMVALAGADLFWSE